jgi:formylglycine-generating enzyme
VFERRIVKRLGGAAGLVGALVLAAPGPASSYVRAPVRATPELPSLPKPLSAGFRERLNESPRLLVHATLRACTASTEPLCTEQEALRASFAAASVCPSDMREVRGSYCPELRQTCTKWIGRDGERLGRCAEFRASSTCKGKSRAKHFCIDRFEFPNHPGDKPALAVSFDDARRTCNGIGKRLCGNQEWTLACEGPERLPYPTGFSRASAACNLDKPYRKPSEARVRNLLTRSQEVARLDQSEPSGAREDCVSAYGVYDMVGNVDEWVVNESGSASRAPFHSGLKGGYWGPVRNRCRPITTDHNRYHVGYQVGFRCCSEPQ